MARLTDEVRKRGLEAGFDAVGICHSEILTPERERYLAWLDQGRHGQMSWMTRDWAMAASDPSSLLTEARSVICVALSYGGEPPQTTPGGDGRFSRYASGEDYHAVIRGRLAALLQAIQGLGGAGRPFVDTAPTMDKALAVRAGLGWQGRNTNLLSAELGSFVFLGGLITDLDLQPDRPVADGCGSCRLCVRACPTGALKGDYTIDARLCISYLTIEHRGPIPRHLRPLVRDWVFGCDICQDVCPPVTRLQDREAPHLRARRLTYVRDQIVESRRARSALSDPNLSG